MKLTEKIKTKIFLQYYGLICLVKVKGLKEKQRLIIYADLFSTKGLQNFTEVQVSLKPLSEVTIEHARRIALLCDVQYPESLGSKKVMASLKSGETKYIDSHKAFVYLQSKGYDLPHYELNGLTLFEVGMAIYEL